MGGKQLYTGALSYLLYRDEGSYLPKMKAVVFTYNTKIL